MNLALNMLSANLAIPSVSADRSANGKLNSEQGISFIDSLNSVISQSDITDAVETKQTIVQPIISANTKPVNRSLVSGMPAALVKKGGNSDGGQAITEFSGILAAETAKADDINTTTQPGQDLLATINNSALAAPMYFILPTANLLPATKAQYAVTTEPSATSIDALTFTQSRIMSNMPELPLGPTPISLGQTDFLNPAGDSIVVNNQVEQNQRLLFNIPESAQPQVAIPVQILNANLNKSLGQIPLPEPNLTADPTLSGAVVANPPKDISRITALSGKETDLTNSNLIADPTLSGKVVVIPQKDVAAIASIFDRITDEPGRQVAEDRLLMIIGNQQVDDVSSFIDGGGNGNLPAEESLLNQVEGAKAPAVGSVDQPNTMSRIAQSVLPGTVSNSRATDAASPSKTSGRITNEPERQVIDQLPLVNVNQQAKGLNNSLIGNEKKDGLTDEGLLSTQTGVAKDSTANNVDGTSSTPFAHRLENLMLPTSDAKQAIPGEIQHQQQADPPTDVHQVISQIIEQARIINKPNNTEMVIKLKPEHLGELTLKVVVDNGTVNASFHSGNTEVRNIIEASLPQLKQDLVNSGLKVENVTVYAGLSQFLPNHDQDRGSRQQQVKFTNKKPADGFIEAVESELEPGKMSGFGSQSGVDYRI